MPRANVPERAGEVSQRSAPAITSARMQELRSSGAHRSLQDGSHDRRERAFLAWMQAAPRMLARSP